MCSDLIFVITRNLHVQYTCIMCCFVQGALACSHLCEQDQRDIIHLANSYRLPELTASDSISQIVIWKQVSHCTVLMQLYACMHSWTGSYCLHNYMIRLLYSFLCCSGISVSTESSYQGTHTMLSEYLCSDSRTREYVCVSAHGDYCCVPLSLSSSH